MAPAPATTHGEGLVYDVRLSSVVPARITGENKVWELTNMDLAMKFHYIKGVYFFDGDAARGLSVADLKKPLFQCLVLFYPLSGRIRVAGESDRPFIKCNDSGVRIVEAKCGKTLEEWLEMESSDSSVNDQLTHDQFLGPDLGFTPLVFFQFTWFKCGGLSIGLSWAHVVGDAFSASHFINMWGQFMAGRLPPQHFDFPQSTTTKVKDNVSSDDHFKAPSSLQKVQPEEPAGGQWRVSNSCKMRNHTFHVTAKQLNQLAQSSELSTKKKPFEVISAMILKSLAKVRGKSSEPKNITIFTRNHTQDSKVPITNSEVIIWTVNVEAANLKVGIAEAHLTELANLLDREKVDETSRVEAAMDEKDISDGKSHDFIVYGANLTFVNLEELKIYWLELKGRKPVYANCNLSGVGDNGAVLVLPAGPENDGGEGKEGRGRMVNLILPENQIEDLKKELQNEWNIF